MTERLVLTQHQDAVRIRLRSTVVEVVFESCDVRAVVKHTCHAVCWRRLVTPQLDWLLPDAVDGHLLVVKHRTPTTHKQDYQRASLQSSKFSFLHHHHHYPCFYMLICG